MNKRKKERKRKKMGKRHDWNGNHRAELRAFQQNPKYQKKMNERKKNMNHPLSSN